jgi:hypothetical protein
METAADVPSIFHFCGGAFRVEKGKTQVGAALTFDICLCRVNELFLGESSLVSGKRGKCCTSQITHNRTKIFDEELPSLQIVKEVKRDCD